MWELIAQKIRHLIFKKGKKKASPTVTQGQAKTDKRHEGSQALFVIEEMTGNEWQMMGDRKIGWQMMGVPQQREIYLALRKQTLMIEYEESW